MTSFSHLWGCEWTPSKAAFWHLLVVKTLWDARGGYRFRSAANARRANASILGDTYLHFQEEYHVILLRPNAHQVLQYHLIIMRFFSSLVLFSSKNQRLEEEKRARVYSFFVRWYINCSASDSFCIFFRSSALKGARKKNLAKLWPHHISNCWHNFTYLFKPVLWYIQFMEVEIKTCTHYYNCKLRHCKHHATL